jgi:phage tail-like protein
MSNAGVSEELFGSFHFLLEVEDINHDEKKILAGFTSISGGGVKIEKRDITHGDDRYKRSMPGIIEYENISMSRGYTTNEDLYEWTQSILDGNVDRRSGSIIMLDNEGEEVRRFNFYGAYPVTLSGPELSSESSAVAVEKFELAVDFTDWG